MNRAYYPVHPTYSQPRQYTASYRSASLPPPPGLPLPVTSFSRIPQHHQYEQIYMASPAQPSTLASTSSSPTLAESEPSKFFPTFKQPADSIVKPWLTHVNPPFSDSLSSDTRNPPPKNRDVQLDFNSNHHPIPYIPTIVRKRAFADPVRYGIESPVWNRHHPWMTSFRAGSITLEPTVRKSHASEIVNNGGIPWDTSIISELTGKFCERVAEGWWVEQDRRGGGGMEWNVAVFAGEVKEGLMLRVGERSSSFFENQLRQCVLSEFRAWWMHVSSFFLCSLLVSDVYFCVIETSFVYSPDPTCFSFTSSQSTSPLSSFSTLNRILHRFLIFLAPRFSLIRSPLSPYPRRSPFNTRRTSRSACYCFTCR